MSYGTHREVGDVAFREAQYNYALKAGAQGLLGGLAGAWGIGWWLNRSYAHVRNLPFSFKVTCVVVSGLGIGVIAADKAGIHFDQMHYKDQSAVLGRTAVSERDAAWNRLSTFDKSLTWAKDHKMSVVLGSWLGSMGLSWLYIQSQPLTFAQKLVQARVWAQGLTVASMVGMAALLQIPSEGDKLLHTDKRVDDRSWEKRLNEQMEQARELPKAPQSSRESIASDKDAILAKLGNDNK